MKVHERIGLIKSKGLSIKKLGQILDRHPSHVGIVLSGKYISPKLRKEIAKVLEIPEDVFWGDSHKQA
jgi:hypothetical protein